MASIEGCGNSYPFHVIKMIRQAISGILFLLSSSVASACSLAFAHDFRPPEGRIAAFGLSVRHGAVASVTKVPPGWQITITNDPSWITKATAQAIVGAAFMSFDSFAGMFLITPETGYSCVSLKAQNLATMKLQLYKSDRLQPVVINPTQLEMNE